MKRVCYFNIGYSCNNACVYCFSISTGKENKNLSFEDFKEVVQLFNPTENDKIIINGGEPTIHPLFYDMLTFINQQYSTSIVVYSNGISIDETKITSIRNLTFVIPIHGYTTSHDAITRHSGSFSATLSTLKKLQKKNIDYSIKFIVNKSMVEEEFNIASFLESNVLSPSKIFIARLNATKKSRDNDVQYPSLREIKYFVQKNHQELKGRLAIVYLDLPFCLLPISSFDTNKNEIPDFYFTDYKEKFKNCLYYKQLLIRRQKCQECEYRKYCLTMEKSYLTVVFENSWDMDLE